MALDNTTSISVTDLRQDLFQVGAEVLHMQGRAMVLDRQVNLKVLTDPTGVGGEAIAAQKSMRKAANYYLSTVMPKLIRIVTDASAARNLVVALKTTLAPVTDPEEAKRLITSVANQLDVYAKNTQDAVQLAQTSVNVTTAASTKLATAIADATAKLDGPNGQIAAAQTEIDATEKEVFDAIQAIVTNADSIGEGVKDLVTYVLSFIGGGDKDNKSDGTSKGDDSSSEKKEKSAPKSGDEKAENGENGDGPSGGGDKEEGGEIAEFPAQSITTISTGVAGISEAQKAIKSGNALLNKQYQAFAAMSAMLAAVQVINSQIGTINKTGASLLTAVSEAATSYGDIASGMTALANKVDQDGGLPAAMSEINAVIADWSRLRGELDDMRAALSGVGSYFPPLSD
ncbi:HBL/NHE enterotoxin family protein [Aliiroseovarius sp. KMU-50]|uniref:HBL/NHE enterotoxin family protein n=1 Tax=Aliiroseovarius salicola TaxID=3009082 RepID=A0ABT4W4Y0_9RHOB|nr:HBL/NHE enterotoxin family protein [Aliiroseovarius sp. KMU-50]MDA5095581.1 HBL/NHE enterotoxin family protein [Aliiroseovarius sp. KMU-50]